MADALKQICPLAFGMAERTINSSNVIATAFPVPGRIPIYP